MYLLDIVPNSPDVIGITLNFIFYGFPSFRVRSCHFPVFRFLSTTLFAPQLPLRSGKIFFPCSRPSHTAVLYSDVKFPKYSFIYRLLCTDNILFRESNPSCLHSSCYIAVPTLSLLLCIFHTFPSELQIVSHQHFWIFSYFIVLFV